MLRNVGGNRFADVTFAGGFGHLQKGHGVAFGDIDNDGDQDLFHQLGGFYPGDAFSNALYANPTTNAHWVTLRLRGTKSNRFGIGARITLRLDDGQGSRSLHRLVGSGGSFGGSSLQQEIGIGVAERIREIEILWPGSATVQRFTDIAADKTYLVSEETDTLEEISTPPETTFEDPSS